MVEHKGIRRVNPDTRACAVHEAWLILFRTYAALRFTACPDSSGLYACHTQYHEIFTNELYKSY
jgi:hypothetical protein